MHRERNPMRERAWLGLPLSILFAIAASPAPALAHADWRIVGLQYTASELGGGGPPTTGYLGNPVTPIEVGSPWSDDGIGSITNLDPLPHTFTECTEACDTTNPRWTGARFDVELGVGASVSGPELAPLNDLFENTTGTFIIFCRYHPFMRAAVELTGG